MQRATSSTPVPQRLRWNLIWIWLSSRTATTRCTTASMRICSLLRKMEEEGVTVPEQADLTVLSAEEELALVKQISLLPEEIIGAAADRDPSRLNKYAVALCAQFHRFYNACRIKEAEDEVRDARLVLCRAARQTIYNVLTMIGVEAPEHM